MDIVIVLDGSNSIYPWYEVQDFLINILHKFYIGPGQTQVGSSLTVQRGSSVVQKGVAFNLFLCCWHEVLWIPEFSRIHEHITTDSQPLAAFSRWWIFTPISVFDDAYCCFLLVGVLCCCFIVLKKEEIKRIIKRIIKFAYRHRYKSTFIHTYSIWQAQMSLWMFFTTKTVIDSSFWAKLWIAVCRQVSLKDIKKMRPSNYLKINDKSRSAVWPDSDRGRCQLLDWSEGLKSKEATSRRAVSQEKYQDLTSKHFCVW